MRPKRLTRERHPEHVRLGMKAFYDRFLLIQILLQVATLAPIVSSESLLEILVVENIIALHWESLTL